jgi:hypothetical protein
VFTKETFAFIAPETKCFHFRLLVSFDHLS